MKAKKRYTTYRTVDGRKVPYQPAQVEARLAIARLEEEGEEVPLALIEAAGPLLPPGLLPRAYGKKLWQEWQKPSEVRASTRQAAMRALLEVEEKLSCYGDPELHRIADEGYSPTPDPKDKDLPPQEPSSPPVDLSTLPPRERLDRLNRRNAARLYEKTSLAMGRSVPPEIAALACQRFLNDPWANFPSEATHPSPPTVAPSPQAPRPPAPQVSMPPSPAAAEEASSPLVNKRRLKALVRRMLSL